MKPFLERPYRPCVGIMLINRKNLVLIAQRIDQVAEAWQMPQGGVNKNEDYLEAAKRELVEETNIKSVKLIKKLDSWLEYELPKKLLGKIWKGKYRGQKQKWFIMKFLGNDNEINIKTENPEFLEWKWIESFKLPNIVVNFKIDIYTRLEKELKSLNLN